MSRPTAPFKVAAVEFNPEMFEFEKNLERACAVIEEAASAGARLIVLPEAALSGYIYADLDQLRPYLDEVPGRGTGAIAEITAKHRCYVAIGISEIDRATGLTYNTGALIGPDGYVGKYRKNGLNPSDIAWFVPGNTGYPVFETELGNVCMIICYDDTYWEPARLPAIKGADLIAYICSSDRVVPHGDETPPGTHSTIAAVQQLCAWNGLAMVAADRNNAETNPTTGVTVTYGGSASIWQANGDRTAHAPATDRNITVSNPGTILYGEIDPALYDNDQKSTLARRRPELYAPLTFFRAPSDPVATTEGINIVCDAVQYRTIAGDFDGNVQRADELIAEVQAKGKESGLLVLPAFSFTGVPANTEQANEWAESGIGRSVQMLSDFAARTGRHVVGSHIERDGTALFHASVLVNPAGTVVGSYRQTHLDPSMTWATEGDALSVFATEIGRIGLLLCEDVRFPEASGVLAMHRADLIAVPTQWRGEYGGYLHDAEGLFAHRYPANTMAHWYAIAKTAQAYTVVANAVDDGRQGSSGVFTLDPVDSAEPPVVGTVDESEVVSVHLRTLGVPGSWMNQHLLVGGRRADLAVPVALDPASSEFLAWRDAPGYEMGAWTAYRQ